MPNAADPSTDTFAAPPSQPPTSRAASAENTAAPPKALSRKPNTMNGATVIAAMSSSLENSALVSSARYTASRAGATGREAYSGASPGPMNSANSVSAISSSGRKAPVRRRTAAITPTIIASASATAPGGAKASARCSVG